MKYTLFLFFILMYGSCFQGKPIPKEWKLKECVMMYLIPTTHYTPYNSDWTLFIENDKYQVKEIHKFKQNRMDSLILIKSDFVLTYASNDIYNDTTLRDNFYRNGKRQIQIINNSLIDGGDTFRIKSLNPFDVLVVDSDAYRLYKFDNP